jgi:hypothetical protein
VVPVPDWSRKAARKSRRISGKLKPKAALTVAEQQLSRRAVQLSNKMKDQCVSAHPFNWNSLRICCMMATMMGVHTERNIGFETDLFRLQLISEVNCY